MSDMTEIVKAHVAELPRLERHVLRLRYGLRGGAPLSLEAVAELLGGTRAYVRKVEGRALAKIRELAAPKTAT